MGSRGTSRRGFMRASEAHVVALASGNSLITTMIRWETTRSAIRIHLPKARLTRMKIPIQDNFRDLGSMNALKRWG